MAPRRKPGWADNVYATRSKGTIYYHYRHPVTGKRTGLGKDLAEANRTARIANNRILAGDDATEQRVGRIIQGRPRFGEAADRFAAYLREARDKKGRRLAPRTLKNYIGNINHFRAKWESREVDRITLREVSDELDAMAPYAANAHRHILDRFFRFCLAKGLRRPMPGEPENPAASTLKRDEVRERERLRKDEYDRIYEYASELGMRWMQTAMESSLLWLQRPQTIVVIRYDDEREADRLFVDQAKVERHGTGHLIIPIGPRSRELIRSSRDDVPSPYLVHRRPDRIDSRQRASKEHWTQVTSEYAGKEFSRLRDALRIRRELPMRARPTLMEVRSLGAKLYRDKGWSKEQVSALFGHTTVKTTEIYLDRDGEKVEYQETPMAL